MADYVLPVCCKNIFVGAVQSLIDLYPSLALILLAEGEELTFAHAPV